MDREGQQQQSNVPLQLTPEEQKVLKECRNESFWKRCVPISFSLAALVHIAVQRGVLKPSARFGSIPKVGISVLFGYIAGKISYKSECEKKIMAQIPNSNLARLLSTRGQAPLSPFSTESWSGQSTPAPRAAAPQEQQSQPREERSASFDFDTFNTNMRSDDGRHTSSPSMDHNYVTGDFDSFNRNMRTENKERRSMQDFDMSSAPASSMADPGQNNITYDELRRRNRDDFDRKLQSSRAPPQSQRGGNDSSGNPQFDGLEENQSRRRF